MPIKQTLIMLKVIAGDEVLRFARIWVQTILPPLITTALYFIIFGQVIGAQIAPVDGYHFIEYIVPGLVLMAVITNAYANTVSSFYSEKFQHSIEEKLVAPVPNHIILLGFISGGVVRGVIVGLLVAVVATLFTSVTITHFIPALLVMVLTATVFALGGLVNGIFAKSFDDISLVPTFVIMPLTYLGGVFYSINALPEAWRTVSLFNPIFYMVNAFRAYTLGVSDTDAWFALALIIGFVVILAALALHLLKRGTGIRA